MSYSPLFSCSLCFSYRQNLLTLITMGIIRTHTSCLTHLTLLLRPLDDALLYGALTDEPIDRHLLGLSEAVGTVHSLLVHRRVPVTVVEDHLGRQGEPVYS